MHHHLDAERGFLDAAQCAALVGDHAHADFYVCGPGPYMDTVEAGLATLGVAPEQVFIERFVVPGRRRAAARRRASTTESLVIRLDRRKHTRARTRPATPSSRPRAAAGLQPAVLVRGGQLRDVHGAPRRGNGAMRVNNALSADEVDDGWVLTCQSVPTSGEVVVDYDA